MRISFARPLQPGIYLIGRTLVPLVRHFPSFAHAIRASVGRRPLIATGLRLHPCIYPIGRTLVPRQPTPFRIFRREQAVLRLCRSRVVQNGNSKTRRWNAPVAKRSGWVERSEIGEADRKAPRHISKRPLLACRVSDLRSSPCPSLPLAALPRVGPRWGGRGPI